MSSQANQSNSSSNGTAGCSPAKADPLWSSIQPTPCQDVGDALAPYSDLEKIMWGLDGIPLGGGEGGDDGDDGVGHAGGHHQQSGDEARQQEEQETDGITPSSSAEFEEAKTDAAAEAAAAASDGARLSCIAWKKRSGLG